MSDTIATLLWAPIGVALIGAGASVVAARNARAAQREASESSPYDALANRVIHLEDRVETLERDLQQQREDAERAARRFRARITLLLHHIDGLTEYAEMLLDLLRLKRVEMEKVPPLPTLPREAREDL